MTVPKDFVEQNKLFEGAQGELHPLGNTLTTQASTRPRYKLADLLAQMPDGLPRVDGWEDMPSAGLEND